jgi:hypothetical protein
LENAGIDGFVEMAQLAQARLLAEKGDLAGAKDALDKLNKRLEKAEIKLQSTLYIGPTVAALQLMIDPTGQLKAQSDAKSDPLSKLKQVGGGTDLETLKKTLQELAQKAGKGAPAPLTTGTQAPAPAAPAPAAPVGTNPTPAPGKQGDPAE